MQKSFMIGAIATALSASAALAGPGDVNPGVIFGSGNSNGSFTTASSGGLELGLRAKVRYNSSGTPENTFNWDGTNTYTFDPSQGSPAANRAMWNFEFSVNTDVDGTSGATLSDFTFELSMFKVNADGTNPADALSWDMINGADPRHGVTAYDHSLGNFDTTSATDFIAGDPGSYQTALDTMSVAQNSWNYGFFNGAGTGPLEGINPALPGDYIIRLTAIDAMGAETTVDITVHVVPLPTAAFAGLGLLGACAGVRRIRRR